MKWPLKKGDHVRVKTTKGVRDGKVFSTPNEGNDCVKILIDGHRPSSATYYHRDFITMVQSAHQDVGINKVIE